ncbi:MAG: fatty acyl-AMP ligase [Candidatus Acidiferrales bacterium]
MHEATLQLPTPAANGGAPLEGAETITQALVERARLAPDQTHINLLDEEERATPITYAELFSGAAAVARALQRRGVAPGDRVGLMLPTSREFFHSFLGTLLAGAVPVPIYPPVRIDKIEEYAERQTALLTNAEARLLITFSAAERLARLLRPRVASLGSVVCAERLAKEENPPTGSLDGFEDGATSRDLALIQYTSGSTSDPRGVALSHGNLLANLRAIGYGVGARPDDVTVCWLPLYHDMGLIGCWLFSLYYGLPIVALSPLAFLRQPERWLRAIQRYRGTLSPAPNFAYELCVRKINGAALDGLDLSSWRVALNGAEPISPDTLARFEERFRPYGFRPETMMPVYGLAESSVALAFAPLSEPPRIDRVARKGFQCERRAVPAADSDAEALRFVSVGRALPEHEVRIVDDNDKPVGERIEGHLQFRGPSAMQGYFRNPDATRAARTDDGWHRTGDLAYCGEGELFITGRSKDLIIKAGRNIYPQEIEEAAAEAEGARRGCIAAFSAPDPRTGTEQLVVVAETRVKNPAARAKLAGEIKRRVSALCCAAPDVVRLVAPQTVPKTPSGKLRRAACRQLYLEEKLEAPRTPAWLQLARLVSASALALLKRKPG